MYNVSEAYKEASLRPSRESRIEGFIKLSEEVTLSFNSYDILSGSLSIDNAAVNGQELNLGTVYTGKLAATIKLSVDRYQLYNKKIWLSYFLKIDDDEWEEVPLGEYYISEAQRSGKYIAISAYDRMLNFDKDFSDLTTGKPYSLIYQCCQKCGMEMEQTEEEIDAMSPFEIIEGEDTKQILQYGLPSDNSISTYRDLLSELAIVLGGFFIIGRTGKLRLMKFGGETGIVINDSIRKSAEIYDYICEYSGVKALLSGEEYIAGTSDNIVLDIGDLGLLKNGLMQTKKNTVNFIYEQIQGLKYTPGSISYIGDPAIDLGDMVTVVGYDADPDGTKMLVTSYNWHFHGNHKLQAVGKNIKVADSKKKTTNQIKTIVESAKQESINKILTFYNSEDFEVGATPYRIARIMVPVSEKTSILVTGQIIMYVTTPGTIKITYKLNDSTRSFSPQQIVPVEGYYMINLLYRLQDIVESSQNIFEVWIESADAEASVELEGCLINLSGSGIVDSDAWDGTMSFRESISAIYLGTINPTIMYKDAIKTTLHSYMIQGLTENYSPLYWDSIWTKWQDADDNCDISWHDQNPATFVENHQRLHFSFGGLNIVDDMQLSVEDETTTE